MYRSDDDKIVSISFDNKQFLNDVNTTLRTLDQLNDATSERNLNGRGLNTLSGAFNSLGKEANTSLSGIDDSFRRLSVPERLSQGLSNLSIGFNVLEGVALGALATIGRKAAEVVMDIPRTLTSGIRDGWSEYNLLIDSTQTLLVNTEKYGTTIDDVTEALDRLNDYADLTIYNFAQMTRNMGYFTTSGMNLDEAQNMVTGMANLAALFGANNESLQRAMYQTSQAMSAGIFRKMDWKSLQNASMSGTLLQEELIRTAAFMSGKTYEEMNDYIQSLGGFYESLDSRNGAWLTADIFSETMRRFAGMTREELEMLRDVHGNALSEEEIDRIVQLGERGLEAAQVVRTLGQMLDSVKESIGSGWTETFRLIIGNLEQAKEFWSPINKLITEATNGISDWRNSIVKSWADVWRVVALEDMKEMLNGLGDVLRAIGEGFSRAFGSTHQIAGQIGRLTEALGDFATTIRLDEEELADLTDFVQGLLSPIVLLCDIFREITIAFFNAGDAMNEFDTRTDSIVDNIRSVRKVILQAMGIFGRIMQDGLVFIRQNNNIQNTIHLLVEKIRTFAHIINNVLLKAVVFLYDIWDKYDISNKIVSICNIGIHYLLILRDTFIEVGNVIYNWFSSIVSRLPDITFVNPLVSIKDLLLAVKDIFIAIIDPTLSVSDAFNNLKHVLGIGEGSATQVTIWNAFSFIKDSLIDLYVALQNTSLGPIFEAIGNVASNVFKVVKIGFAALIGGITGLGNILKNTRIGSYLDTIKNGLVNLYNTLKDSNFHDVISTISSTVSNAFSNIATSIGENGFIGTIVNFIKNIKESIETRITFQRPNVITAVEDVADNIRNATSKLTDFGEFNSKLNSIRNVANNVKDVIQSLMPTESSKNASNGVTVIKNVLDFIEPVSKQSDKITVGVTAITSALDSVASVKTDSAAINTQKIAYVIAAFVGIFKYLVNSFISIVGILSVFNFSKWSDLIKTALDDMTLAITNGFSGVALSIKSIAESIGGAIKSFGTALQEKYKAEEFKAVAEIFKTVAILAGIIFIGVALISQFGDPKSFTETIRIFAVNFALILLSIGAMVTMIISAAGNLSKKAKALDVSATTSLLGAALILQVLKGLLTRIIVFTAVLSAVAMKVAQMPADQQTAFYKALDVLMQVFTAIIIAVTTIFAVLTLLSSTVDTIDITGLTGTKTIATITAIGLALKGVINAITFLMIGVAVAIAIMAKSTPNKELLETSAGILKWFARILLVFVGVIAFLSSVGDAFLIDGLLKAKLILDAATRNFLVFGLSVVAILMAFSVLATNLIVASTGLLTVLASLENIDAAVTRFKDVMKVITSLIVIIAAVLLLVAAISQQATSALGVVNAAGMMLTFAGAIWLISKSLLAISTAIVGLATVTELVGRANMKASVRALEELLVITTICVALFMALGTHVELAMRALPTIIAGVSGMYIMAHAILLMATGISMLASVDASVNKIKAAADALNNLMGAFTWFFGILSVLLSVLTTVSMELSIKNNLFGINGTEADIITVLGGLSSAILMMGAAAAIASVGLAQLVKAGSVDQIKAAADGIHKVMSLILEVFTVISLVIGVLAAIPPTRAAGGTLAAVMLAIAAAFVAIGSSIALAGYGMKQGAEGIETYADALRKLESIDRSKVYNSLTLLSDTLPNILASIINTMPLITTAIKLFFVSVGQAIANGIVGFFTALYNIMVVSESGVIEMIGAIFIGIIDGILTITGDFLTEICGENGRLWTVLNPLGDFLVQVADWIGYYGVMIAASFVKGICEALADMKIVTLLGYSLYTLYAGAVQLFYESFGITSIWDLGKLAGLNFAEGILQGLLEGFRPVYEFISGLDELDQQTLIAASPALELFTQMANQLDMWGGGAKSGGGGSHGNGTHNGNVGVNAFDRARAAIYGQADSQYNDTIRYWDQLAEDVDGLTNDMDMLGRTHRKIDEEASRSQGVITSITDIISDFLGLGENDFSIFGEDGLFGSLFGDGFGIGNLGTQISDATSGIETAISDNGIDSGSAWADGFASSIADVTPTAEDNLDLDTFRDTIAKTGALPDDVRNPVITPVWDDSQLRSDAQATLNWWNGKTYDQFAIDAGNSMLLREEAEGDAATDGNISISYTQINNSPKELSPIEIYRDTKNLLRGSGKFALS